MPRGSIGGQAAHLSDADDGGHSVDYDGGLRAVAEEHRIAVFQSGAQPIVRTDADIDSPFLNLVGNAPGAARVGEPARPNGSGSGNGHGPGPARPAAPPGAPRQAATSR